MRIYPAQPSGNEAGEARWRRLSRCLIFSWVLCAEIASAQHLHGQIDIGIVVEEQTLAIALNAPLTDLMGFEHAPRNDAQALRLTQAANLLSDSKAMFALPTQAACTIEEILVEGPEYLEQLISAPAKSAQQDHQDSHEHAEDHHSEHAEVNAQYRWACQSTQPLDSLEARFVVGFEKPEQIEVQILTETSTRVFKATASNEPLTISLR